MKKIMTREEKEKKETRNKTIIGLLLVFLLIVSTAGYAFFSGSQENIRKVKYKDTEFILNNNGRWQFEYGNFIFATQYNPLDTENVSVPIFINIESYYGYPLFLSGESIGMREIAINFNSIAGKIQGACIQENLENCDASLPIKNCSEDNIIIFEKSNFTEIRQQESCVFISAPYENEILAADAFLFKLLGLK